MSNAWVEWRPFVADSNVAPICSICDSVAGESLAGWVFRYIGVRGQGRHGPKVRTERRCPKCKEPED